MFCCCSRIPRGDEFDQDFDRDAVPAQHGTTIPIVTDVEYIINVNDVVTVQNLANFSNLNGSIGIVMEFVGNNDPNKQRWKVQLQDGKIVSVKSENLFVNRPRINVGDRVTITGLRGQKAKELNGKRGKVIRFVPNSETIGNDGGRWIVDLIDGSKQNIGLKSNNLFVCQQGRDSLKHIPFARADHSCGMVIDSEKGVVNSGAWTDDIPVVFARKDKLIVEN